MFHYTDMKWTATGFSNFPDCNVQILTNIFSSDFVAYSTSGAFILVFTGYMTVITWTGTDCVPFLP